MPPSALSQTFPPAPTFLPKNLTSLTGKVFIVTGAASGVGYELAKILYTAGGSVYIGARSSTRCLDAIENIKAAVAAEGAGRDNGKKGNRAGGKLSSLVIDLADLSTVKNAAVNFLAVETRLDSLIHNAGVMQPPAGSKDKQVCSNFPTSITGTNRYNREMISRLAFIASDHTSSHNFLSLCFARLLSPPAHLVFEWYS